MNPQEVNAYYDPHRNEIVFPAGILQTPFFDKNRPTCMNYGAIGTVIAHEITHGYDDQGRKYDHNGNIVNWWSDEDLVKFNSISKSMIEQYDSYEVNGKNVNGKLTLGENLADLGGITLSYRALVEAEPTLTEKDKQDFFISYASGWKRIMTPEKAMTQILSDPHSPGKFRVFMVRNIDEFYQAFGYDKTDDVEREGSMYLPANKRIKMW